MSSDLPYNWKSQPHQSSTQSYLTVRIRPTLLISCAVHHVRTHSGCFLQHSILNLPPERKSLNVLWLLLTAACVWPLVGCISSGSPGKFQQSTEWHQWREQITCCSMGTRHHLYLMKRTLVPLSVRLVIWRTCGRRWPRPLRMLLLFFILVKNIATKSLRPLLLFVFHAGSNRNLHNESTVLFWEFKDKTRWWIVHKMKLWSNHEIIIEATTQYILHTACSRAVCCYHKTN